MKPGTLLVFALVLLLGVAAFAHEAAAVTFLFQCQPLGSGSYVVAANVTANGDCFVVTNHDVSINLNGHTIKGNGTGAAITDGGNSFEHVSVVGGTITGFDTGIELGHTIFYQIQSMRIYDVASVGISVQAVGLIGNNIIHTNGVGIQAVGCPSLVQNVAIDNPGGNLTVVVKKGGCKAVDNLGI